MRPLTVQQVADRAGVSAWFIREEIKLGRLQAFRPHRGSRSPYRIQREDFERWWNASRVSGPEMGKLTVVGGGR